MKKSIGLVALVIALCAPAAMHAQEVKHAAEKVGNKTAEVASKGKSKVVDKTYKDKEGPNGETIYIDKHDKCYWVDKKGHKEYISKKELRDKPKH